MGIIGVVNVYVIELKTMSEPYSTI